MTLVSSACDVVSTAYASTKESHPYVRSVCDAAEKGVKSVTETTASCVQPVLTMLEPHGNPLWKGRFAPAPEGLWLLPALEVVLGCGNAPFHHHTKKRTPGLQVRLKS